MSRRTGKAGGDTPQGTQNTGSNLRQDLKENVSTPLGLAMADAVAADALMVMAKSLESGQYGPLTQQVLSSLTNGTSAPFEDWTAEIEAWLMPPALRAAAELDG